MRLSGLFIALVLLASSTVIVCAQHAGGSSGGGGSHGGGGFSSSAGSMGGHASVGSGSHVSMPTTTHASSSAKLSSTKLSPAKETSEKGRSFFHPFRKPQVVEVPEFKKPCLRGTCAVCPPGSGRNGSGMCVNSRNSCQYSWGAFACGTQAWMYQDCSGLAAQLEAQHRQMRGRTDTGESIIYQRLKDQYQQCLMRGSVHPFAAYSLTDAALLDTPW